MSEIPINIGQVVEIKLRSRLVKGVIYSQCEKPKFRCEKVETILNFQFSEKYLKIIKFISQYYFCSIGEATNLFWFDGMEDERKKSQILDNSSLLCGIELSPEQEEAYNFIISKPLSLLFGDTGSGKTEIYMKLFEDTIKQNKSAIFLMPEISLTPQMLKRVKEKFGDMVELWHSKLTKKRRAEILERILSGEVKIVAGARSALFLPISDLGLIVVDEEHDDSYKASNRPRYHARDLAIYMGGVLGVKVVLGSATPSLTSYYKFPHFRLRGTYFKSSKRFIFDKDNSSLNENIISQIKSSLDSDKQVIVFVPTRANFKYLNCHECGGFVECPYCSVGMSLHLDRNALICHYCNYVEKIPNQCPECKSSDIRVERIGTAQIVDELSAIFKDCNIAKFDTDEITTQKKLNRVIEDFNSKKIDILVGTQMLSKGHNYLDVDLAVVMGIDNILAMPDFRSRERAVTLLIQIAGRSGRRGEGRVVIQSRNVEFFNKYLEDYELFLKDEMNYRKDLYPPFRRVVKILIKSKDKMKAKDELLKVANCLSQKEGIEIIGAGEAPISRISNKYRFNILLRSSSVRMILEAVSLCKSSMCEIDIDPVNFS